MTIASLRAWAWIHRWTSLVCTLFLLLICASGLPLLFEDEIDHWLSPTHYAPVPPGTRPASLDRIVAEGRRLYPGQVVISLYRDDDEPQTFLYMAPSWAALKADSGSEHFIRFDSRTGQVLERPEREQLGFMQVMLALHTDLFMDLPGELFLGFMGLLFVAAIVSGLVLYGPFARKLGFGTVRADRSRRLKWLDLHNLLGVVTVCWALVVGVTGVMNELSSPLFALWLRTDVHAMLAPWQGRAPLDQSGISSVQAAFDVASRVRTNLKVSSIAFPGSEYGSPYHYLLWAKGNTPLTSRLYSPVLVDAKTGALTGVVGMPWYLRVLELSRPLHFGDYGGMPLKILWALFDLVTIAVLGSGLYLWFAKRRVPVELPRMEAFEAERGP